MNCIASVLKKYGIIMEQQPRPVVGIHGVIAIGCNFDFAQNGELPQAGFFFEE